MVAKLRKMQLLIKQPHGTLYGHWTNLMCRFCQNVGNHEKLPGDTVLLLNEILDIVCVICFIFGFFLLVFRVHLICFFLFLKDFSSNDLVCVVCLFSVAEIKKIYGFRVKERPPSTCRPVGLVVPQPDDNDVPISPIGSLDRFLANFPTPMLSEHSSIAASSSEASSIAASSANVTSTSSRYARRKKKSKANSLYKQSLLNMLKKASK